MGRGGGGIAAPHRWVGWVIGPKVTIDPDWVVGWQEGAFLRRYDRYLTTLKDTLQTST